MNYEIFNENCLIGMKRIADGTIDAIICDLPFGTTDLPQDKRLPMDEMWTEFKRVTKKNAAIVLFSQMPFGSDLIQANKSMYRYEIIYEKALATGFLNSHKMPTRKHENILVFYRELPTFNPQFTKGKTYKKSEQNTSTKNYRDLNGKPNRESDGWRFPMDILKFRQPFVEGGGGYHPQQKPVDLLEYLIKTYTDEGETVFDATMGSGSTGVAAINTGRKFIGFELDKEFFVIAKARISEAMERREKLFASGKMKVIEKATAELKPYENNPRINDNAVDAVAKSISEFGFKVPIVIDSANVIICGHTRWRAAQVLGLEKVPCIIADDLSEEEIKAFRLVDNKTSELASWAVDDLNKELASLSNCGMESYGFDMTAVEGVDLSPDNFSENFSLDMDKAAERKDFEINFLLHKKQSALVKRAMPKELEELGDESQSRRSGDLIFEIIRQWLEARNDMGTTEETKTTGEN